MYVGSIPAVTSSRRRGLGSALLLGLLTGCLPATAAYLSIPIEAENGADRAAALVRVELADLARRMDPFDAHALAFYHLGRAPIPHELADEDGDGNPDVARVALPVRGDGTTVLIAVCPGPTATGSVDPEASPEGVRLRLDLAHR